MRDRGVTIVLVTHFMEAERLCDRVALIDAGRVVAIDSIIRRGDVVVVTGSNNALNAVTSVLARHQIVAHQLRVEQARRTRSPR